MLRTIRTTAVVGLSLCYLLFAQNSSQHFDPKYTISLLDPAVHEIQLQLTSDKSLEPADHAGVVKLAQKQTEQLEIVKKKYNNVTSCNKKTFETDLAPLFELGVELQKQLAASKKQPAASKSQMHSAEYSPDPQQCANHCYQTCGYNSLGDKVCWYSCYRCCGRGGC
jgi:hypothetical protein